MSTCPFCLTRALGIISATDFTMPLSLDGPSSALAPIPSGNGNAALESSTQVQQKRNRIQLSCAHCRHAKLKCDRENPCSQCIKKGRASLCIYPAPTKRKKPAASMQNRLKHLESLVKGVMTSQSPSQVNDISPQAIGPLPATKIAQHPNPAESATNFEPLSDSAHQNSGLSTSSGQVVVGPNESTYVGATHWAAILNDVNVQLF